MLLTLKRSEPRGDTLRGECYIDGQFFCATIENQRYCLYPGWYPLRVTQSPKFHRLLPILDNTFPRTGIRIHAGSRPRHSRGCILVPADQEKRLTDTILQAQRNHETIYIDIQPCPLPADDEPLLLRTATLVPHCA